MKKLLVATVVALALANPTATLAQAFPQGSNSVSAGYGFVTFLGALNRTFDGYDGTKITGLGPIYFKYERALTDLISVGVNFAYAQNQWSYNYYDTYWDSNTNLYHETVYNETTSRVTYSILARMNFHFGRFDKFDPYAGFGIGYRDAIWTQTTNDPYGTSGVVLSNLMPVGFETTFGVRYFFTDNIGAFSEVGIAKSFLQFGVSLKF